MTEDGKSAWGRIFPISLLESVPDVREVQSTYSQIWFGFYVYMYTCMYIHARGRRQWSCAAILYSRVRVGTYVTSAALHVHVHVFEEHRSICTRTSAYIYM
jgi:hypothetical protein